MPESPRTMSDKRTQKEIDEALGTIENSKLLEWGNFNYELAKRHGENVLVRPGIVKEIIKESKSLTLVSFGEASRVTFEGESRVGFAGLIEAFGIENVREATGLRIKRGREFINLSAREERRKRTELPAMLRRRWGLTPGRRITVQLISEEEAEDIIPLVELEYEVYLHFDYVDDGDVLRRRVNGKGTKRITMGASAPIGIRGTDAEDDFWDVIYSDLETEIKDEFFERMKNSDALLGQEENFNEVTIYKGFAKDGAELKKDAKREGSP